MMLTTPWSKKHKAVTKHGGLPFNLSNSFAQPLTCGELLALTRARGDEALVKAYSDHGLGYTPNGGSRDLREEGARLYTEVGADGVVVFPGAQVALQTASLALVGKGDHAIVFTPGYQSVVEAPLHAGAEVTRIPLRFADGWDVDVDAVRAAIVPGKTRYLVLNQPYNPAGTLVSRSTFFSLVALARAHGLWVLCDEVYRLLEHDAGDRLPAIADAYERGISCVTMSKPWGACGVSIGWLAFSNTADGLRERLLDAQYFGTACPSRASELQATMVLRASDAILAKNLEIIRANVRLVDDFMAKHADLFEWVRPRAGAIGFVRFKGHLSSTDLGDDLAEAGISVKPAYCFTADADPDPNHDLFRVGFGEAKMPAALAALDALADEKRAAWLGAKRPRRA